MVVNQVRTTPPWQTLAVLLLAWLPAVAVGWLSYQALAGASRSGLGWIGLWFGCVLVAVGVGTLVTRMLPARLRGVPAVRWAGFVAVGWAIAMAAGWFFSVELGGPAFGLVTGLALASAGTAARMSRVAAVAGCGLVGLVAGWWLVGDRAPVLVLVGTATCGLLAVAAIGRVLTPSTRLWATVGLTYLWGAAWVGSYALTQAFLSSISHGLAVGAEIVVAVALGASVLGFGSRSATGEPVVQVVLRWTLAATIGVIGSIAVAVLLHGLAADGPAAGIFAHLDLGSSVGLGAAAGFAVLPTLLRIRPADATAPAVVR